METKLNSARYWSRMVFILGITKIPLLAYVRPRVIQISADEVQVRIRLRRRTKNHLKSMYFGVLAVGADTAAGIHAFYFGKKWNLPISFAFKAMKAEFLRRATSDVIFIVKEGSAIESAVVQARDSGERVNLPVHVNAIDAQGELVATFEMTISVKVSKR